MFYMSYDSALEDECGARYGNSLNSAYRPTSSTRLKKILMSGKEHDCPGRWDASAIEACPDGHFSKNSKL